MEENSTSDNDDDEDDDDDMDDDEIMNANNTTSPQPSTQTHQQQQPRRGRSASVGEVGEIMSGEGGMDGGDVCEGVVLVSESSDRVKKGSRIPVKLICNTLPRISNPSPIQPTNHTTIDNNSIFIFKLFNPKT